jgi:uncharacterized protein
VKEVVGRLTINLPVVTEVVHMLDFSPQAQRDFLLWAERSTTIDTGAGEDLPRVRALLEKYADLPADVTDASLVALGERLHTSTVASVDSDFTIYRTRDRKTFRNLFFAG